jgi:signal transduction histidine kinase
VQVAIAIQQAQLFCQVQQQAQREQLLNKINRALSSSLDPETILQEIVTRTGEGFQVDRVVLYEISNCIKARNEWRSQPSIPSMLELRLPLTAWPDINDPNGTYAQRQPFHVPNYCQLPPTAGRQLEAQVYQTRSILAVPICIQGELFGSIALHTTLSERVFMPEEIQLLQRIADQAAVALYNAQSYENLEQLVQDRTQALEKEKIISEAANRAKSEFLTTMSHELRTPLNAILGLSQVLQQGLFGDLNPKQAEYVAHIHSSGDHLLCLINDILDLAKIEAGRETLAPTLISVAELCESSLALVREQAYANGLELTSAIAPAAQQVWADERRLRQMLLNLLSNAVKFTPTGRVSLNVDQHDTHISFAVIDTGIGIAPEKLSLLFQPFSQLDSQLNRQYPGSGLGLVLTRNLARLHGGDVTVTSQLGKGSEFTLILPNPPRHKLASCGLSARSPIAPAMLKPQVSSGRILIVEDDPYSALLIRDYLHAVGHQVYHLEDGYQFIQTVRQFRPNLILLDMQLADKLTGLDLLKQLQQQPELRTIPTAIVTAMAMVGDRETFLEAGASDYLSKPVDIIRLESILMKYL